MTFDLLFNVLTILSVIALLLSIVVQFVTEKGRTKYE